MPRVNLTELSSYEFQHFETVRATDINYAGHLGNEALLGLVHEARLQFLKRLGFDTIVGKENQVGLVIADMGVNFKAEAFVGDPLTIDCRIDEQSQKSFRLYYRVRRDDEVIALVETGLVAFDYRVGRATALPEAFLIDLKNYRGTE
jgi:YbgC/YbaW family acyl-CoA thioester hydrolase